MSIIEVYGGLRLFNKSLSLQDITNNDELDVAEYKWQWGSNENLMPSSASTVISGSATFTSSFTERKDPAGRFQGRITSTTTSAYCTMSGTVSLVEDNIYTIVFWIKATNFANSVRLNIQSPDTNYLQANGTWGASANNITDFYCTTEWVRKTVEFTANATGNFTITIRNVNNGITGIVWIDAVELNRAGCYVDLNKFNAETSYWHSTPSESNTAEVSNVHRILIDEATVVNWYDVSGNDRHLAQNTKVNQPYYIHDPLGGKLAVYSDGFDDSMATADFSLEQPLTLYAVFKRGAFTEGRGIIDGLTENSMAIKSSGTEGAILVTAGGDGILLTDMDELNKYYVLAVVLDGENSLAHINNHDPVTGSVGTANPGGITIGSLAASLTSENVTFREIAVYTGAHSDIYRKKIVRALMKQHGVQD